MESLPQELVQAIVREIDDIPSLKACALAGSIFRDASQRMLLWSLTLAPGNVDKAQTLLAESPHVATHITRLIIRSPKAGVIDTELETVQQNIQAVLDQLTNVRQCIINGIHGSDTTFILTLFEFLVRQPLHELNVLGWGDVPSATIL
ncbi:hypothetical protein C8R45DRAFT_1110519 [Mycena sanguinolenta]|nr:hypothetical protein C8R45DRAFT_1110519 [Mycena sanguinolenta]